jgi:2-polyprenyl-3-methyl-5-hydroxy-6-metoxy-1,4-benzoquinol methylase
MNTSTKELFDTLRAEEFAGRMLEILNGGALGLMVSIGHRTGLFDTLAKLPPSTPERIADAAGLNGRYVREWLDALVTGNIIEYDQENRTYFLPYEHAALLTRASTQGNMAATLQFISVLGSVEDKIVECFYRGGGVPYSAFPRFQEVMAEESNQTVAAALVDSILPLAPGLIEALERGIQVLDLGCGSGHAINLMARAFPKSQFTGYDLSYEGIIAARAEAKAEGLSNVRFDIRDVATLTDADRFGLITAFDAIHDQAKPAQVLKGVARALREDGIFLMQDITGSSHVHNNIGHPLAPFLYTISCMHCMTVSLAQNGEGLGTMWGEEKAGEMLAAAGFRKVEIKRLPHDIMNNFYVAIK